ncbi:hypothetical protein RHGRI_029458 [Rhododendron griersonianum]|uniref:Endonuclease/exonuclease/phosphatase domain-containing protein n=1 Tax=Rhododendron griersonianum TaxID=479676 RepID=A0AAV6IK19_9ERIC|nr:hypothetical protein RHGRI_029458 [Rhododendron griersonianum]
MVRRNRPSIVFLMETKNNKVFLEAFRRSLRFDYASYVDPVGHAGGLALWWKSEVTLDIEISSKNIVHTLVLNNDGSQPWAATFIYGCPYREGREQVWEDLRRIGRSEKFPWLCMGDFNEVLSSTDKRGGNLPSHRRLGSFRDMLNDCGLVDLEFKGPKFTWRNNRAAGDLIMERIDMAFANANWREEFDQAIVFVEAAIGSDHNPLILNTSFPLNKVVVDHRRGRHSRLLSDVLVAIKLGEVGIVSGNPEEHLCGRIKGGGGIVAVEKWWCDSDGEMMVVQWWRCGGGGGGGGGGVVVVWNSDGYGGGSGVVMVAVVVGVVAVVVVVWWLSDNGDGGLVVVVGMVAIMVVVVE